MSIVVHNSTVYGLPGNAERVDIVHDAVQMLLDYAGCTLVSEDTDWEDYYDAVVDAGGGVTYRIYLYVPSGAWRHRLTIYRGYLRNGEFVSLESSSSNGLNTPGSTEREQYATLIVINGGSLWHLQFRFYYSEGGAGYRYNTIRSAKVVSSLTGAEYTTGLISGNNVGVISNVPFPYDGGTTTSDYIRINGTDYALQYIKQTYAIYNIPSDKIMLFPSLITLSAVDNNLGVPTIDGQMSYYMALPSVVSLPAYTEFEVDGMRFVSLGNLAIRSV